MKSQKLPGIGKRIVFLFHSIRFRLVLWFAAILTIVLAAFSGFIYVNQARDIQGQAQFRLERKMAALEETLTVLPMGSSFPKEFCKTPMF